MSQVATAPHECEGNLIYVANGLSPYWTVGSLYLGHFDGSSDEIDVEVDGEEWTVTFNYQKGGIAPRPTDDVGGDRLYEYRIGAYGNGERKANFLIQPRFPKMRHYESGEKISNPFDNADPDKAVNVSFGGSNLEPEEYRDLLPEFVQALAHEAGEFVNLEYFAGEPHEFSNVTTYERYVRVTRNMGKKMVRRTGIMHRLLTLCATERGSKFEYRVDNEEIVGKNHRAIIPKADAMRLIGEHSLGKQLKHYHPKHVRDGDDDDDPLYHPKVGVLVKKSLNGHAFKWHDREKIRREIDEMLINALSWSGIPTKPDPTTFVADDHFPVRASERSVPLYDDPTPEMEADQEALLVTTLRDMTDSDEEVLETLVEESGEKHPAELAEETDRGMSTIYRALKRLRGLVHNDNASVGFVSKKVEQEIAAIVESAEYQIESAADRAAKLLNVDARQAASSAWQQWLNEYAADIVEAANDEQKLRIDTILSRLKATSQPRVEDVLADALEAWRMAGRDPVELLEMAVEWRDAKKNWQVGKVGAVVA